MIHVKTSQGKIISIEVSLQLDTVENLKNKIEEKMPLITRNQMLLVFEGTELKDENTLDSYQIKKESTLSLIPKSESAPKQETHSDTAVGKERDGTKCCVIL